MVVPDLNDAPIQKLLHPTHADVEWGGALRPRVRIRGGFVGTVRILIVTLEVLDATVRRPFGPDRKGVSLPVVFPHDRRQRQTVVLLSSEAEPSVPSDAYGLTPEQG